MAKHPTILIPLLYLMPRSTFVTVMSGEKTRMMGLS